MGWKYQFLIDGNDGIGIERDYRYLDYKEEFFATHTGTEEWQL